MTIFRRTGLLSLLQIGWTVIKLHGQRMGSPLRRQRETGWRRHIAERKEFGEGVGYGGDEAPPHPLEPIAGLDGVWWRAPDIGFGHSDIRTFSGHSDICIDPPVNIGPDAHRTTVFRTFGHFFRTFSGHWTENGHSDIGSDILRTFFHLFSGLLTGPHRSQWPVFIGVKRQFGHFWVSDIAGHLSSRK
jgi:hypothetical protein